MPSDVITRVAQLNSCMRARNGHARTHAWHANGKKTLIIRKKIVQKVSYSSNNQMSAPTRYLKGKTPYGDINAKVEYSNSNNKITLTLSYKDLAEVLENSNKPNLASLNLILILEIEDQEKPDEPQLVPLHIPEELKFKSVAEIKALADKTQ